MNNLQRIRLGLLTAKLKLDNIFTRDWEKDPNPENWRTINGSHVHLVNGRIDGGAGGKFKGNEWHGQKAHGSNSFFPRFNYQQNLFGEQEVMPSKTMQKEQNRQGRIARRAERRNARYEAKKAAGLAKQAEYRAQLTNKSPWEMNKRELKAERERLEKMDANNYWSFSHSPSSQRGYSAEAAERLAQVRAASGEKVYPWQWNKEMAKRRKIPEARHEEAIKKALEQGLPVPDDVRAEYNKAVKAKQKPSALESIAARQTAKAPEQKTYSALEAVAELRKRANARKAAATSTAEKPKSTAPKKKGNMKSRLWDNAKEAGIDLESFHVGGGRWDKRGTIFIDLDKMPPEQKTAFTQMAKEKGYKLAWNGGLGYSVKEVAAPKPQRALKAAEKTPPPEGYEEYLQRKNSGKLNSYEEQQEARRERFEGRAEKAQQEGQQRFATARGIMSAIPAGQPILVGHHSEKRHRSDLNKVDTNMRKGFEAQEKANYYAGRAESVGTGGISSVDPDAKFKVYEKLNTLEEARERMKLANHIYNSHSNEADRLAAYKEAGFSDKLIGVIQRNSGGNKEPFYNFQIANNNAEIRRLKQRLEDLSKSASTEGSKLESNTLYDLTHEDGRYQFKFDGKPSEEVRSILKRNGFKWSPSRGTWVRAAAGNGNYAMKQVQKELEPHIVIPF